MNYTILDIFSSLIAFVLFSLVLVVPGYVVGWALDLFYFSRRQFIVKLGIGCLLSFVVSPIVLFLISFFLSTKIALVVLGLCFIAYLLVIAQEGNRFSFDPVSKNLMAVGMLWTMIVILSLVGFQWQDQLFLSTISFDQTTRVSIVEAITRTGVPPINPSYYPGRPVLITYLYYFWYIPCSLVDMLAGRSVDAFASLIASSVWSGLGLMTLVAFYVRERTAYFVGSKWRSARIGVNLLAVSGLDVIPILFLMFSLHTLVGSIDVWNTWIQSWAASNLWAPHHVAALIAGSVSVMLAHYARGQTKPRQLVIFGIAGLGFASAFGLSLYVTLVFGAFWAVWFIVLCFKKMDSGVLAGMVFAGVIALVAVFPFLLGLFQGNGSGGGLPIKFEIRSFLQIESLVITWPSYLRNLVMLIFLPINYMMELGYFSLAGLYWFKLHDKKSYFSQPYFLAEIILLVVVLVIGSCLRSTVILSNDLGWRAWLPGQFVLLVWGVDLFGRFISSSQVKLNAEALRTQSVLLIFISIGVVTTIADLGLLRTAWPILAGDETNQRYYFGRLAYEYVGNETPEDVIVQDNPLSILNLNRPSGLFGSRQMIISNRTLYGVPSQDVERLKNEIGALFQNEDLKNWQTADNLCQKYSIDILIFNDADPAWKDISRLKMQRLPLYENERYALFACGEYAH